MSRTGQIRTLIYSIILVAFSACDIPVNTQLELSEIVPETAVFGLQLRSKQEVAELLTSDFPEILEEISALRVDELLKTDLMNSLKSEYLSLSWHSVSKNELAPLLIVVPQQSGQLESLLRKNFELKGGIETSVFNGEELHKIGAINWVEIDGVLGVSTAEVLVEDLVRAVETEEARLNLSFFDQKFYINNNRLNEVFDNSFFDNTYFSEGITGLDLTFESDHVLFQGFSNSTTEVGGFNAPILAESYIPADHEYIKWYNLTNEELEGNLTKLGLKVYNQPLAVYLYATNNAEQRRNELFELIKGQLQASDSLPYQESFAGEEILYLEGDYFKELLNADDLQSGAFFSIVDQLAIVSSSDEAIRKCLAAHADETTIGQLVNERLKIDELIQDTYFTQLTKNNGLQGLEQVVLQANKVNNGMLINGAITYASSSFIAADLNSVSDNSVLSANAFLDTQAATRATVMANHITRQKEVVVQDVKNDFYQISLEGQINWKVAIEGQIKSQILQLDYYNNGKLQYLFATDSLMYIIDRNGQKISGFPKAHGVTNPINHLVLVDYDKTKRYRYLIESGRGDLNLFDKELNPLEGWSPKTLQAVLLNMPFHKRIAGKDFFLIAERSNRLHLINRRGQDYKGLPINLDMRFSGDVYLDVRPTFANTEVVLLSDQGQLVSVNLLGQKAKTEQLIRPNNHTSFELLTDVLGNGFIIKRADDRETVFLDMNGQMLFTLPYVVSNGVELNYYRFGNGAEVVMMWNKDNSEVTLLDLTGRKLASVFKSDFEPSLLYFQNKRTYQMFVNLGNEVNIYNITPSTE